MTRQFSLIVFAAMIAAGCGGPGPEGAKPVGRWQLVDQISVIEFKADGTWQIGKLFGTYKTEGSTLVAEVDPQFHQQVEGYRKTYEDALSKGFRLFGWSPTEKVQKLKYRFTNEELVLTQADGVAYRWVPESKGKSPIPR